MKLVIADRRIVFIAVFYLTNYLLYEYAAQSCGMHGS